MGEDVGFGSSFSSTEYWRQVLEGEDIALLRAQKLFSGLRAPPRCKLCRAPFAGPWSPVLRVMGFKPGSLNKQICSKCTHRMEEHEGGAEIPVSVLYIDVRDSTTIAEAVTAAEFKELLNGFYTTTAAVIDSERGVIDHAAGDGMMAMWIPGFVGQAHPQHAISAGRRLANALADQGLPVGVGVHTGVAYVGVVGDDSFRDFTVLGDTANTVARLSSAASSGELAISEDIAARAKLDTSGFEHRSLELKGKSTAFPTWIESTRT